MSVTPTPTSRPRTVACRTSHARHAKAPSLRTNGLFQAVLALVAVFVVVRVALFASFATIGTPMTLFAVAVDLLGAVALAMVALWLVFRWLDRPGTRR